MRKVGFVVLAMMLVWATGCSRFSIEYGKSKGISGRQSLNGFGGLRQAFKSAGFDSRDITRLTDRVRRSDVIVWTPQEFGPIPPNVTRWFENWLQEGDHALVYVIPDSGSEVDYWREASRLAPPDQRLEYRKSAARAINQRAAWRLNRRAVPSNGWFSVSPSVSQVNPVSDDHSVDTELKLTAYQIPVPPANSANSAGTATGGATGTAVNPGPRFGGIGANGPNSIGIVPSTTTATKTNVVFESELSNAKGETVVATIQSERWDQSRVVVVAGGSMLTNFALTRLAGRELADQIIESSNASVMNDANADGSELPKVGFLTTDWSGISVSERKPGAPIASGMELLTVWPVSLVTIHGILLGLVVCLTLMPIFGRPRRLRRVDHSDFGDHLDAVAALMRKAGGEGFARQRISEYFKRIRGENSGPWVQPDTSEHPSFTMQRPASKTDSNKS